ncbi:hypothetical protein GCM10010259_43070 [Streptomyces daghestanicus]|uniref:Uncharacterized protein n=1 Tax=Streptomyces daghestanicus TaxID=66885 RepID=A0ABQ3PZ02_9ACTN|nr:hypothetical protein GCM10010240_46330 [Streptomyces griseoviridis]GGU47461.1 hypothetical protein GCM10010259_43070 [Streptomyces daghestanicus]GHI30258.1 hypothetical protein Sdagh_19880 [Streptomyces daghestanicus]
MTLVTRGQLQPSRAHPRTASRIPDLPVPTIKEGYSASGARCSPMGRLVPQLRARGRRFPLPGGTGVSRFIAVTGGGSREPLWFRHVHRTS